MALRKIANLLKPDKEIVQDGDHMIIRTLSTFRNYIMDFQVGKEFEEDLTGIDDRKCMVRPLESLVSPALRFCPRPELAHLEGAKIWWLGNSVDLLSQPQSPRGRFGRLNPPFRCWWLDKIDCLVSCEGPNSAGCSDTRGIIKVRPNCEAIGARSFYR